MSNAYQNSPWSELTVLKMTKVSVAGQEVEVPIEAPVQVRMTYGETEEPVEFSQENTPDGDVRLHVYVSPQQKIRHAVALTGPGVVWDTLDAFCKERGLLQLADDLVINDDGSIDNVETGHQLTDDELQDFVEWAEGRV